MLRLRKKLHISTFASPSSPLPPSQMKPHGHEPHMPENFQPRQPLSLLLPGSASMFRFLSMTHFPMPCLVLCLEFLHQSLCLSQFTFMHERRIPIHTVMYFALNNFLANDSMDSPLAINGVDKVAVNGVSQVIIIIVTSGNTLSVL